MNSAVLNQPLKQCITKVGLLFIFIYGRFRDNSKSEISAFSDSLKYGNLTKAWLQKQRNTNNSVQRIFDRQDQNPEEENERNIAKGTTDPGVDCFGQ